MPLGGLDPAQRLVRRAKAVRGTIRFRMRCSPRFDYARAQHASRAEAGILVFISNGNDGTALRLRASVPIRLDQGDGVAEFELAAGQSAAFVLEDMVQGIDSAAGDPHFVTAAFKATSNFWRRWVARSNYRGCWRDTVNRSTLVLKLLTSFEHGSMAVAPTFGLPRTGFMGGLGRHQALDQLGCGELAAAG